ncbi:hypothetical protein SUGI_1186480 [Cryptomeria japonica]|nr:hypothetical protein SUGI_1186480 [Cryptomeria japonica]
MEKASSVAQDEIHCLNQIAGNDKADKDLQAKELVDKLSSNKEHVTALDPKSRAAGGTKTLWLETPFTLVVAMEGEKPIRNVEG